MSIVRKQLDEIPPMSKERTASQGNDITEEENSIKPVNYLYQKT